ncbi:gene transfer agent family protein [Phyllobacterium salinisoli]|uniref:Gene transfer agent family protein n=1 Tax=Phyllobacterium salinisoli TaxID=1899321 RepID=A0A368JX52_9HYPH|nr:gene transfer agent family protein [Phyllobacterium salinisoli]RCS21464.1 gene transfer agent family protein [Phyllobacterium salinisoli]
MSEKQHYARFEAPFGDKIYPFQLGWSEAASFEEEHKVSLYLLCRQMAATSSCEIKHLRDILRWALIGGGMPSTSALGLIHRYVEGRPIGEFFPLALRILEAAFFGNEEAKDGD